MKNFFVAADRLYAIPGWLLARLLLRCFKHHPLRNRKLTLSDWANHRTNDMRAFDACFWIGIASFIYGLHIILAKVSA